MCKGEGTRAQECTKCTINSAREHKSVQETVREREHKSPRERQCKKAQERAGTSKSKLAYNEHFETGKSPTIIGRNRNYIKQLNHMLAFTHHRKQYYESTHKEKSIILQLSGQKEHGIVP